MKWTIFGLGTLRLTFRVNRYGSLRGSTPTKNGIFKILHSLAVYSTMSESYLSSKNFEIIIISIWMTRTHIFGILGDSAVTGIPFASESGVRVSPWPGSWLITWSFQLLNQKSWLVSISNLSAPQGSPMMRMGHDGRCSDRF